MAKEESMKMEGSILEELGNAMFRVKLDNNGPIITAYLGGKIRKHRIKIILGDRVSVEMSPYDLTKGRIIYRNK